MSRGLGIRNLSQILKDKTNLFNGYRKYGKVLEEKHMKRLGVRRSLVYLKNWRKASVVGAA